MDSTRALSPTSCARAPMSSCFERSPSLWPCRSRDRLRPHAETHCLGLESAGVHEPPPLQSARGRGRRRVSRIPPMSSTCGNSWQVSAGAGSSSCVHLDGGSRPRPRISFSSRPECLMQSSRRVCQTKVSRSLGNSRLTNAGRECRSDCPRRTPSRVTPYVGCSALPGLEYEHLSARPAEVRHHHEQPVQGGFEKRRACHDRAVGGLEDAPAAVGASLEE